jgi:membrane protease YdiL (CAAX protease family)
MTGTVVQPPTQAGGARWTAALLSAGLAGAVALRRGIDGWPGATSIPAAVTFTAVLLALAGLGAALLQRDRSWARTGTPVAVLAGLAGAAVLAAAPFVQHVLHPGPSLPLERLPAWTAAVVGVALAEEVLLRGVLWRALRQATPDAGRGPGLALVVTTVAFAVLHVPFYGVGSLPVDLAAGLLLGALRQWTGTVTAPAVAHLAADLAGWWLQ